MSEVDLTQPLKLLKKWFGQDGFKSLEEGVASGLTKEQ